MSKRGKDRLFWLMVAVIIGGQGVLVWALVKQSPSALEAVGWITGAVIPFVTFLYTQLQKRSLRVFLLTSKLRSLFSSHALTWSLSANFKKQDLMPDVLERISETLLHEYKGQATIKVKRVTRNETLVEIDPGPTIDLTYTPGTFIVDVSEEDKWPYVQVTIRNYRVGYRQAEHVIKRELLPVLETIGNVIREWRKSW